MLTVECPSCGKRLNAPGRAVGKNVRCKCGRTFEVRHPPGQRVRRSKRLPMVTILVSSCVVTAAISSGITAIALRDVSKQSAKTFTNSAPPFAKVSAPHPLKPDEQKEQLEALKRDLNEALTGLRRFMDKSASLTADNTRLAKEALAARNESLALAKQATERETRFHNAFLAHMARMSKDDQAEAIALMDLAKKRTITLDQLGRLKHLIGDNSWDLVHLFLPGIEKNDEDMDKQFLGNPGTRNEK
jgi:hypothetical protein